MSAKPAVIQYPTGGFGGEDGARRVSVRLEDGRVYTLADDVILIAEKDEMRSMMDRLEGYLE